MATAIDIGTMIVRTPGTVGGRPRIEGSRIRVSNVVIARAHGDSVEEIAGERFPSITVAQVHAALAYYFANRAEIDREILDDELAGYEGEADSLRAGFGSSWMTEEERKGQIAELERSAALLRSRLE